MRILGRFGKLFKCKYNPLAALTILQCILFTFVLCIGSLVSYANYSDLMLIVLSLLVTVPHVVGAATHLRVLSMYGYEPSITWLTFILTICVAIIIGILGRTIYPNEIFIPYYMYQGITASLILKSLIYGSLYSVVCNIMPDSTSRNLFSAFLALSIMLLVTIGMLPNMLDSFVFFAITGEYSMLKVSIIISLANILGVCLVCEFYKLLYGAYNDYMKYEKSSNDSGKI